MKRLLITLTILLLATMAAAQTPYWLTAINAIGRPGDSASISSVVYADGYIAYHYRQTMRWGEREISSPNFNVALARVADDGSADWLVDIGGVTVDSEEPDNKTAGDDTIFWFDLAADETKTIVVS